MQPADGRLPSTSNKAEATIEQLQTAEVLSYLGLLDILRSGIDNYVVWRKNKESRSEVPKEAPANIIASVLTALEDFYSASNDQPALERLRRDYGEEQYLFEQILRQLQPAIEEAQTELLSKAHILTLADRFKAAVKAGRAFGALSAHQQETLLRKAGYSKGEIKNIAKNIAVAAAITAGATAAIEPAVGAAAFTIGVAHPFIKPLPSIDALIKVGATHSLYYGTIVAIAEMNLRRVKSNKVSFDVFGTGAYYLADRFLPHHPRRRDNASRLAVVGVEVLKEALWGAPLFFNPSITAYGDLMGIPLTLGYALAPAAVGQVARMGGAFQVARSRLQEPSVQVVRD